MCIRDSYYTVPQWRQNWMPTGRKAKPPVAGRVEDQYQNEDGDTQQLDRKKKGKKPVEPKKIDDFVEDFDSDARDSLDGRESHED